MRPKVKKVLRRLEGFFLNKKNSKEDKDDLWSILTALRGNDDGSMTVKYTFTGPIRNATFPDMFGTEPLFTLRDDRFTKLTLSQQVGAFGNNVKLRIPTEEEMRISNISTHYYGHIKRAVEALERE